MRAARDSIRSGFRSGFRPTLGAGEDELLRYSFSDPLIRSDKIHDPICSIEGIEDVNRSLLLDANLFFDAYEQISLIGPESLSIDGGATNLLVVDYSLGGEERRAYAYARKGAPSRSAATLIIPGSGQNQSRAIYEDREDNYQTGIRRAMPPELDWYVFIKPNQDCLAFHDGHHKLRRELLMHWQVNHGGSYSAA